MKSQFIKKKKEAPMSARRQLYYTRQQEGETIEEFAQRAYFITMDGYDKCETKIVETIAIETFLRGCRDKEDANKVMERDPSTLIHAVKLVKTSIANHRALFGSSKNSNYAYYQRQVTFADTESPRSTSPVNNQANSSSLEQEVRNLTGVLDKWVQNAEKKDRSQCNNRFSSTRNNYQSTNIKSNDQPYDRYPQMPHRNREYGNTNGYTNRDTRFTYSDQGHINYGSEYRSPTPLERPNRRYTNYRSPSPPVNSRAQYLYANDRNTDKWRLNSPGDERKTDQRLD
jgi:hypothetical protein